MLSHSLSALDLLQTQLNSLVFRSSTSHRKQTLEGMLERGQFTGAASKASSIYALGDVSAAPQEAQQELTNHPQSAHKFFTIHDQGNQTTNNQLKCLFGTLLADVLVSQDAASAPRAPEWPHRVHLISQSGVCFDRRREGSVHVLPAEENLQFQLGCRFQEVLAPERRVCEEMKKDADKLRALERELGDLEERVELTKVALQGYEGTDAYCQAEILHRDESRSTRKAPSSASKKRKKKKS